MALFEEADLRSKARFSISVSVSVSAYMSGCRALSYCSSTNHVCLCATMIPDMVIMGLLASHTVRKTTIKCLLL